MFFVAGDGGCAQVLDADPATSDCETNDGCGGDDEIPVLYGETQTLDDVDSGDYGCRDWAVKVRHETQLVDTCADEPSDRTEMVSEEAGPSTVAGTSCDASSGGRGCAEERADGGGQWPLEKEDDSFDSDASSDNEDDISAGSRRRSFTDIRAKAVRSSGLAASRHLASKELDGFRMNNWAESRRYLTNRYSEIGELHLENGMENSIWSSEDHYKQGNKDNRNSRVRKLFDETYLEKDESGGQAGDTDEPKGMSHLFAADNVAGLSYVVSQEPGDQSQDNALEVIDKFLLTNDIGSSQEFKNGISDIVKCAPVSCTKIFRHLAGKTYRRNSIGIPSIFDWDDNCEDEGGGEFFCKRKDLLFEGTTAIRNAKSHHKIRRSISGRSRAVFGNDQKIKSESKIYCNNASVFAYSDSHLMMHNSIKNNVLHISQTKTRKNLLNTMDVESNPRAQGANIEITDVEVVYNCGSDTQMAAESMETLYHASPVKPDKEDRHLTHGISVQKTNSVAKQRTPLKSALHQNVTSLVDPSNAEGIITHSRRRIRATKERRESSILHTNLSIKSRMKKSQENRCSEMKMRLEKLKLLGQLAAESSERHATSESVKRKKGESRLYKTSNKNVDISVDQQNGDSLHNKELKNGDQDDDYAPVAHRTRHSKRAKLLEDAESLNKGSEPNGNGLIGMQKEGKFSADASVTQVTRAGSPNIGPPLDVEVRKCSSSSSGVPISDTVLEESRVNFLLGALDNQPKHKRTTQVAQHTLAKQISEDNGNKPFVSIDNQARMDGHTKNGERNKVYIRSVSQLLLKAKQKRRIVSTQMLLEYNALLSDSKLAPGMALRTRSVQKSPLESNKCLSRSVCNQVGPVELVTLWSDDLNDHVVDAKKLSSHSFSEDGMHAEENAGLKCSSRGTIQSPCLACATPSKRKNVLSPVCMAEDLPRSPKRDSITSVARELLRLEPAEASATPIHKDLRRRKYLASVHVLFSNHLGEDTVKQQKKILTRLGLAVAFSILDATHFVTDKFVRTQNMLEAIAVGKPVVTPMWLESCGQASSFLDEKNYILRDTKREKEIGFNMQVSLARARQRPILLGKTVYMTPNVKPSRQVLSSVVKAANGQAITRIGRSITKQTGVPANLLIISCLEDYSLCIPLLEKGARIFSPELLLNGIVIQKLDYGRHELFLDHVKRTRSTIWLKDKAGQFLPVNNCT